MCSIIGYCGKPMDMAAFQAAFSKTISRGPDDSRMMEVGEGFLFAAGMESKTFLLECKKTTKQYPLHSCAEGA